MKKILTVLFSLSLVIFSCKNDNSDSDGLSTDESVYFTITFNGKTLTQYGSKSTDPLYNNNLLSYLSAKITTDYNANESNVFITAEGSGGYMGGLNNRIVSANILINKIGESLGVYYNLVGEGWSIQDSAAPHTVYYIDKTNCTFTINTDYRYVTGTFNFNLIIDNKLVPATGSFKLNRL